MEFLGYLFSSGPKGVFAGIGLILTFIGLVIGFLSAVIRILAKIYDAEYSLAQYKIGGLIMVVGLLMFLIFSR